MRNPKRSILGGGGVRLKASWLIGFVGLGHWHRAECSGLNHQNEVGGYIFFTFRKPTESFSQLFMSSDIRACRVECPIMVGVRVWGLEGYGLPRTLLVQGLGDL